MTASAPGTLLVESTPHQDRVALVEEGRVVELALERRRGWSAVGSIFKGRVSRVLPGIQAAFVDIGLERDAFLYVDDAHGGSFRPRGDERGDGDEPEAEGEGEGEGERGASPPSIDELVRPGQELVVQVLKDPLASKGARITTQVTLPGRYLVLLPTVDHLGISRRIDQPAERQRLREVVEGLRPPEVGMIVRTAGEGKGEAEFAADRDRLLALWTEIRRGAAEGRVPVRLHRDLELPVRMVRDLLGPEVDRVVVEGEEAFAAIVDFLARSGSGLVDRVRRHRGEEPLFASRGIEEEIDAALRSRVWLGSGGYLVISPTEALIAIDVNTGRYVGRTNLEETVVRINLEAVVEVVRQIRLRDLAGIIVVDFIDMESAENRREVFTALERELARDRVRSRVLAISEFGLVEITRKRSRASLHSVLTRPCPHCAGAGRIRSVETVCLALRRRALAEIAAAPGAGLELRVHPEVAQALRDGERAVLEELRERAGGGVEVVAAPELHEERFRVLTR